MYRLIALSLLTAASMAVALAQAAAAAPATIVSAQDMQDALKSAPSGQSEINKIVKGVSAPARRSALISIAAPVPKRAGCCTSV